MDNNVIKKQIMKNVLPSVFVKPIHFESLYQDIGEGNEKKK